MDIPDPVWNSIFGIPEADDAQEAYLIVRSLTDDPEPPEAKTNTHSFREQPRPGCDVLLSSGRGFVTYVFDKTEEGEEYVAVLAVTHVDLFG